MINAVFALIPGLDSCTLFTHAYTDQMPVFSLSAHCLCAPRSCGPPVFHQYVHQPGTSSLDISSVSIQHIPFASLCYKHEDGTRSYLQKKYFTCPSPSHSWRSRYINTERRERRWISATKCMACHDLDVTHAFHVVCSRGSHVVVVSFFNFLGFSPILHGMVHDVCATTDAWLSSPCVYDCLLAMNSRA